MHLLTDSLLAGQWTLQGHASGRPVWAGTGLKHGGDIEGLQAQTKKNNCQERHADHTCCQSLTVYKQRVEIEGESIVFELTQSAESSEKQTLRGKG